MGHRQTTNPFTTFGNGNAHSQHQSYSGRFGASGGSLIPEDQHLNPRSRGYHPYQYSSYPNYSREPARFLPQPPHAPFQPLPPPDHHRGMFKRKRSSGVGSSSGPLSFPENGFHHGSSSLDDDSWRTGRRRFSYTPAPHPSYSSANPCYASGNFRSYPSYTHYNQRVLGPPNSNGLGLGHPQVHLTGPLRNTADEYVGMRLDVDSMSYEELLSLGERIGVVSTGLSPNIISNCIAPVHFFNDKRCAICLEMYEEGREEVGRLKRCGHDYHVRCITKWLLIKNVCPICKLAALKDDV